MRLHHAGSVKAIASSASARNGFVILVLRITKGQIVHSRLATSHHT